MARDRNSINEIVIHCTASGPQTTLEDIRKWHKQRGWKDIGYHYVILSDGQLRQGRPWNQEGAHTEHHNAHSIGIALVGGNDGKKLHKFTKEQMTTLEVLVDGLQLSFPGIKSIVGHRHYASKECPNFDVEEWLKTKKVVYLQ